MCKEEEEEEECLQWEEEEKEHLQLKEKEHLHKEAKWLHCEEDNVPDNLDGEKNTIPYYIVIENNRG